MNEHSITDVPYDIVEQLEVQRFKISEISDKLNISPTKLNHLIFKLNKIEGLFENTSSFSNKDIELIELCKSLLDDGMSIDKVINYIKDDANSLINPETGMQTRGMEETDIQIITKNATLEVKRQTDRILEELRENVSKELIGAFTVEAEKIAKIAIEAMGQTKDAIDKNLVNMTNEITTLREDNQKQGKEIERLYSNQTTALRNKLAENQERIAALERENQELRNKGLFSKLFKR